MNKKIQRAKNRRADIESKIREAQARRMSAQHTNSEGTPGPYSVPAMKSVTPAMQKQINERQRKQGEISARRTINKRSGRTRQRPDHISVANTNKMGQPLILDPKPQVLEVPSWFENKEGVDVSIIVPMYYSDVVIKEQIESWDLTTQDELLKEIIYIDDQCPHNSFEHVLAAWGKRKDQLSRPVGKIIVNNNRCGYSTANNVGVRYASGKYLLFLNADCKVTPNWIRPLYDFMESHKDVGIVGNMQLREKDDRIESVGSRWDWHSKTFIHIGPPKTLADAPPEYTTPQEREMVTGCCFMMSSLLYRDLGGFDERYRIGYWEDSDLCMRVRSAGYKIYCQPESRIYHKMGHSRAGGHSLVKNNRDLFQRTWVKTGRINTLVHSPQDKELPKKLPKDNIQGDVVGCIIACNEEEFLAASVESVTPIVNRFVFVIGGNEYAQKSGMCDPKGYPLDNTLEIAKELSQKYNGIVIEPPGRLWKDKVEMRNAYANHLKSGDWMFMLDGDEVYKEEQLWKIAELSKTYEAMIFNFWVFWNNVNTIGTGTWDKFPQERMVRWREGYKYRGKNHLFVTDSNNHQINKTRPCWRGSDRMFYHYSWVRPLEKIKQKREYYKHQSGFKDDNYFDEVFLKWRENPDSVKGKTHPLGGGGFERFIGIHPPQVESLIKEGKLQF